MLATKNRFHRRNHVNRVYRDGSSVRGGMISLKYRIAPSGTHKKIAVVVSKKVAKSAVTRNRIRRRVFEVIRHQLEVLPEGFEGVFGVYEAKVATISDKELTSAISTLLAKATK